MMPKLMMKERTVVAEAILNSCAPISGTTVLCNPTIPPTKALMSTSRENCSQFAQPEYDCGRGLRRRIRVDGAHHARIGLPELVARTSAACGGGGGISASIARTKATS